MSSPPTRGSHQLSSRFSLFSLKTDDHLGRRRRRLLLLVDRPHQISWDVVPGAPPPSSWGLLSAHPAPIRSRKPGETKDQRQYLAACWPGPSTRQTVSHISPPLPRLCANLPLLLFLQAFPAFGFLLVWGGLWGPGTNTKSSPSTHYGAPPVVPSRPYWPTTVRPKPTFIDDTSLLLLRPALPFSSRSSSSSSPPSPSFAPSGGGLWGGREGGPEDQCKREEEEV